jgi:hypothetical protein
MLMDFKELRERDRMEIQLCEVKISMQGGGSVVPVVLLTDNYKFSVNFSMRSVIH